MESSAGSSSVFTNNRADNGVGQPLRTPPPMLLKWGPPLPLLEGIQPLSVVQPRKPAHHHPPSSLRCVSVRPQQSPSRRGFTTEMAAKVCRSVLLLSRSSGAVAGSLPALVVSSQRHHQHIRPVSPRTSVRTERGVGPARLDRREAVVVAGLAKEVS
eukprot:superscaffoldBa00005009_g19774